MQPQLEGRHSRAAQAVGRSPPGQPESEASFDRGVGRQLHLRRDEGWSESLAVGSRAFTEQVQSELGIDARHRGILADGDRHRLRETPARYDEVFGLEMDGLSVDNAISFNESH